MAASARGPLSRRSLLRAARREPRSKILAGLRKVCSSRDGSREWQLARPTTIGRDNRAVRSVTVDLTGTSAR
jgi:hypothetical protein